MQDKLKKLEKEALAQLEATKDLATLKEFETNTLGKKSELNAILRGLKDLSPEEKKTIGQAANIIKQALNEKLEEKRAQLEGKTIESQLKKDFFDTTIPGKARSQGHVHPLSSTQEEVERIFSQMGFAIMDGPEAESEYYNFEGLNIPADHPARARRG